MMKTKNTPILVVLFMSLLMALVSCNDDESENDTLNESPVIELITKIDATGIIPGPTITIKTNITDNDGVVVAAKLFIDNIEIETLSTTPYNFSWNTESANTGTYLVKITATDDKGATTTLEKEAKLIETFTCGDDFFDTRDGNIYRTVQIGDQCWMAENLNYNTNEEGCWNYLNSESNGQLYGKLYSMEAALIVSPDGWHLPSDEEWKILEGTVDTQFAVGDMEWDDWGYRGFDAGLRLKSTTGWDENGNGTDAFGFNALPGGFSYLMSFEEDRKFENLGYSAPFWTATSTDEDNFYLWNRELFSSKDNIDRSFNNDWGLAVRCIKD